MPVMPKADTVVAEAPLAALPVADAEALLPVALPVDEPVAEALAADDPPAAVLLLPLPAVAEPLSLTTVFTQLVSEPAMMEAWAEKALVPVLSLMSALKLVPAWRSTVQVKDVPEVSGNCLMGFAPWEGMSDKK